jgi:hypothetical protein
MSGTPQNRTEKESRRDFLKNAGKLAAYAPPAMVMLMKPSGDAIARSGGFVNCNNGLGQLINDCQPKGLLDKPDLWNDRPSSIPGNPNN